MQDGLKHLEKRELEGRNEIIPTFRGSSDFFPQALSFLGSVITSYPFFYCPKDLRLGDAWHFHRPECYYKRVAREVIAVLGTCGCGSIGPGRGAGMWHSLGTLNPACAPPCAADLCMAAE